MWTEPARPNPTLPDPDDEMDDGLFLAHVQKVMAIARQRAADGLGPTDTDCPAGTLTPPILYRPVISAGDAPFRERRRSTRRLAGRRVWAGVRTGTPGPAWDLGIELVDASADGVGLRTRGPVVIDTDVTVELSIPSASRPIRVPARVRWSQPIGDGTYQAGFLLRRRLTAAELASLTG